MKKSIKLFIGLGVLVLAAGGIQWGLKYYLQGPARPYNALLISGDAAGIDQAKTLYKENTEYTKDYRYKEIAKIEKVLDQNGEVVVTDGVEEIYERKFLVMTKETAKEMLEDQVLRVRKEGARETGSLETEILKHIENIDGNKSIFLGDPQDNEEIQINGKKIDWVEGRQTWIGYYPDNGALVITDEETYQAIKGEELTVSLIKFAKGTKDLRNAEDKAEPIQRLSQIPNIAIDYTNTQK